jgi:hypothetical protein
MELSPKVLALAAFAASLGLATAGNLAQGPVRGSIQSVAVSPAGDIFVADRTDPNGGPGRPKNPFGLLAAPGGSLYLLAPWSRPHPPR